MEEEVEEERRVDAQHVDMEKREEGWGRNRGGEMEGGKEEEEEGGELGWISGSSGAARGRRVIQWD